MILRTALPPLARVVTGVQVIERVPIPAERPLIVIANHTSHLDVLVLWSVLPPGLRDVCRPVAARDYWERGVRRRVADGVFGALLIDRHPSLPGENLGERAVAAMSAALAEGSSLILFPEGTRGDGTTVAPFRSGLYHLCAAHPEVPVLPVFLENLARMLPKGRSLPLPLLSRAVFGAPLQLGAGEEKPAFLERARDAVAALRAAA